MAKTVNNKPAFDINDLIKGTYNKIAEWHNDNGTASGLQHLSFEIVSEIIEESFKHLGLEVGFDLDVDQEIKKKLDDAKSEKQKRVGVNDLNGLSDEELIREVMRRKKMKEND